jgi:hypothetical protein
MKYATNFIPVMITPNTNTKEIIRKRFFWFSNTLSFFQRYPKINKNVPKLDG